MPEPRGYDISLDVMHRPLEVIDLPAAVAACPGPWCNRTLVRVNDSVVRLGVIQGEFHWHRHDGDDEFFFVLEGRLLIDLEGRTIELGPNQGVTVPRSTMHRPRAPARTVMLMVETSTIVPTGTQQ